MKGLLDLYLTFCKIGGTTFGGGYAMLPIIQREIVEDRHWATEDEVMDYYAIGQCTPGIIAVNTATFIGTRQFGVLGGILATLGVVTPSVVIITIIAIFLQNFADIALIKHAFAGIRVCVCVLILDAVIKLGKKSLVDNKCIILFLIVMALSLFTSVSSAVLVVAAGVAGYLLKPDSSAKAAETASDGKKTGKEKK